MAVENKEGISIGWLIARIVYYVYIVALLVYFYNEGGGSSGGLEYIGEGMKSEGVIFHLLVVAVVAQKFGTNIEKYLVVGPFYFLVLHPAAAIALILLKYIITTRSIIHIIAVGAYTGYIVLESNEDIYSALHENSLYKLLGIFILVSLITLFKKDGVLSKLNQERLVKRDEALRDKSEREYLARQEEQVRKKQEEIDAYNKKIREENRDKPDVDSGIF